MAKATSTTSSDGQPTRSRLWLRVQSALALLFFLIGLIGAFLPLLPTTVFWILACIFAFRGSPRLRAFMLNHPVFGPGLRLWFEHGAISRRSKIFAVLSMTASSAFVTWILWERWVIIAIAVGTLAAVALWIATRREGPRSAPSTGTGTPEKP